jgi:hypothetical protein
MVKQEDSGMQGTVAQMRLGRLRLIFCGVISANTFIAQRLAVMDEGVKKTVTAIPLLTIKAGPRDPNWSDRLKEELSALIASVNKNKAEDNDWFKIAPQDKTGTLWKGTCWFIHEHVKYEFNLQFEVPVTYPETAPEIEIPSLDGKTAKIYRRVPHAHALVFLMP